MAEDEGDVYGVPFKMRVTFNVYIQRIADIKLTTNLFFTLHKHILDQKIIKLVHHTVCAVYIFIPQRMYQIASALPQLLL